MYRMKSRRYSKRAMRRRNLRKKTIRKKKGKTRRTTLMRGGFLGFIKKKNKCSEKSKKQLENTIKKLQKRITEINNVIVGCGSDKAQIVFKHDDRDDEKALLGGPSAPVYEDD